MGRFFASIPWVFDRSTGHAGSSGILAGPLRKFATPARCRRYLDPQFGIAADVHITQVKKGRLPEPPSIPSSPPSLFAGVALF